jgi:hypothetical protein
MSELPDEAYAVALALLPKVGPATLRELTASDQGLADGDWRDH